ncbi:Hypothetical protein CINCED_3A011662 [Cinara cedri]|uniref:Protein kinase domain-containing protein n=1 Tax=Cinara cedri TaxID=506608 RepID=A0A5E4MW68_9HEMI|nr:Hypothetical protein CINCED_3A011662 [Cinara cedri]
MDQYVKHMKRKPDVLPTKNENDAGKLRVVTDVGQADVTETKQVLVGGQCSPATPQKTCLPPLESTTLTPIVHQTIQQNRITVNRRLQFDDEIIVTPVKKRHIVDNNSRPKEIILPNHADSLFFDDEMQQKGILNKTPNLHISTSIEKDIILLKEKKRVQAIVESLLVRGFSVQKLPKELVNSYKPVNETNDEGSLVFECMSLIEGFVYSVHVIDTALQDKVDAVRVAARTLATVGPHPHIISYFSNWTDGRFHYVQMELYHDHLLLPNSEQRFDCHTILEHVSCALHYLHDYKNYAHNLVNRWNIYRITDSGSDSVVYKLAGFHRATKLTTVDNDKSVVNTDVKSLCSTVLELLEEQRGDGYSVADDNVEQELWSYLLSIMDRIDLVVGVIDGGLSSSSQMDVNALNVWRWCYNFRRQHIQRPCPTGLMTGIVYRDSHQ